MSLQDQVMEAMKMAMKSKDADALQALRAIKSALLLAQTESGSNREISETDEIKILQKQVKQRKDSAGIFLEQGRKDLAESELAEAKIIAQFLPEQMSEEEVTMVIDGIIAESGASSMKDMGKVMGMANGRLAGKADGKTISSIIKTRLF
jgi:uncharacterized protein YqeY